MERKTQNRRPEAIWAKDSIFYASFLLTSGVYLLIIYSKLNTGRKKLAGKAPNRAAEGVTLSGKQTAGGRHSGESAAGHAAVPKVQWPGNTVKSLRQKDGKSAANIAGKGFFPALFV